MNTQNEQGKIMMNRFLSVLAKELHTANYTHLLYIMVYEPEIKERIIPGLDRTFSINVHTRDSIHALWNMEIQRRYDGHFEKLPGDRAMELLTSNMPIVSTPLSHQLQSLSSTYRVAVSETFPPLMDWMSAGEYPLDELYLTICLCGEVKGVYKKKINTINIKEAINDYLITGAFRIH